MQLQHEMIFVTEARQIKICSLFCQVAMDGTAGISPESREKQLEHNDCCKHDII